MGRVVAFLASDEASFVTVSVIRTDSAQIVGTGGCGYYHRTRRFLDRHHVAYQWIDASSDPRAYEMIRAINRGNRSVPTLVFPDGSVMTEPSDRALGRKLGIAPSS